MPNRDADSLMSLARDPSDSARRRLMARMSELIGAEMSERAETLTSDILLHLVGHVETRLRQDLAAQLSENPRAPHALILALANDEISVSEPLLRRSEVLTDADLIEIIARHDGPHRLAVAGRAHLDSQVTSALVASRDIEVIVTLLQNEGAEFARSTLRTLADEAKTEDRLQAPLLARPEVDTELAVDLYWWVGTRLRQRILDRFEIDSRTLDRALETTLQSAIDDVSGRLDLNVEDLADQLHARGKITSYLLIESLRRRRMGVFNALFARLAGLSSETVQTMIAQGGGESLALACRAVRIQKSAFASIFLLSRAGRPDDQIVDPEELSRALAAWDRIGADSAARILRQWRDDPSYVVAGSSPILNR